MAVTFFAAILPNRNNSLVAIFLLCCIIPTSSAYSQLISLNGIYFYDGFVLGYIVRLLFEACLSKRFRVLVPKIYLLIFVLSFAMFAFSALHSEINKYFLKDTRPLINMLFFVLVFDLYRKSDMEISAEQKRKMFVISSIAAFVKLSSMSLGVYEYQDEYYEANNFRYLDASTYFCVIYLVAVMVNKDRETSYSLKVVLTSIAAVVLSNSRFIIISMGAVAFFENLKKPGKLISTVMLSICIVGLLYFISHALNVDRVISNLSLEQISKQLVIRFGPAFELIDNFHWANYIYGLGAGTTFEIPWFAYRGLDTTHSNIDSAYLTYFVKYGIIGIILLFGFLITAIPNSRISNPVRLFMIGMFFVTATPYQPYCIGLIASYLWVERK